MAKLTPTAGLYLEPDTSPYTGTTLDPCAALINGVDYTAVSGNWVYNYSYGVNMGVNARLDYIDIFCIHTGGDLDTFHANTCDLRVYSSSNNSTWTLEETFNVGDFTVLSHSSNKIKFRLILADPPTAKYYKVVAVNGNGSNYVIVDDGFSGDPVSVGEFEMFGELIPTELTIDNSACLSAVETLILNRKIVYGYTERNISAVYESWSVPGTYTSDSTLQDGDVYGGGPESKWLKNRFCVIDMGSITSLEAIAIYLEYHPDSENPHTSTIGNTLAQDAGDGAFVIYASNTEPLNSTEYTVSSYDGDYIFSGNTDDCTLVETSGEHVFDSENIVSNTKKCYLLKFDTAQSYRYFHIQARSFNYAGTEYAVGVITDSYVHEFNLKEVEVYVIAADADNSICDSLIENLVLTTDTLTVTNASSDSVIQNVVLTDNYLNEIKNSVCTFLIENIGLTSDGISIQDSICETVSQEPNLSHLWGDFKNRAKLTAPTPTCTAQSGSWSTTVSLTAKFPTIVAGGHNVASLEFPMATMTAVGSIDQEDSAILYAPKAKCNATGLVGTTGITIATAKFPQCYASGSKEVYATGGMTATFASITASGIFDSITVESVDTEYTIPTVYAEGYTESRFSNYVMQYTA